MKGLAQASRTGRNPGSPISRLFCRSDRHHALEGMEIRRGENGTLPSKRDKMSGNRDRHHAPSLPSEVERQSA
jgi:hypothetical protein